MVNAKGFICAFSSAGSLLTCDPSPHSSEFDAVVNNCCSITIYNLYKVYIMIQTHFSTAELNPFMGVFIKLRNTDARWSEDF